MAPIVQPTGPSPTIGLEVEPIALIVVRGDRFWVAVDHHGSMSGFSQGPGCLGRSSVEKKSQ